MHSVDVLVVGGGPAGAATAITLASRGVAVMVIDKATFPRDKCCGDGLTTGALRLLESLGLDPGAVESWNQVSDIVVAGPLGRTATFPLPRDRGIFAAVARRVDLDEAVLDLARKAGADVREGHRLIGATMGRDNVTAHVDGLGDVAASYVIGADGMWSPLRRTLGVTLPGYRGDWHAFRQYFTDVSPKAAAELMIWFEPDLLPGYAWSFPLADGTVNVGFGVVRGERLSGAELNATWTDLLARPHIVDFLGPDARPESDHRAWPIPTRLPGPILTDRRALFVGDAAALGDPMTGEGIGQALASGIAAADAILEAGLQDARSARRNYESWVRENLRADNKLAALLSRALRHRKGARAAIAVAGATPWTRQHFARWLFEDEPRAALLTPRRVHRDFLHRDGAYRT